MSKINVDTAKLATDLAAICRAYFVKCVRSFGKMKGCCIWKYDSKDSGCISE